MRTYLDCYPCFVRQSLSAARMAGADDDARRDVVRATLALLQDLPEEASPPRIAHAVHTLVRERVGHADPYRAIKDAGTQAALAVLPELQHRVASSPDPFDAAVRLAIAGNIIDAGVSDDVPDLLATVDRVLGTPLAVDHTGALRAALADADHVLYLADNAGETVFDVVLLERLDVPVTYVVKGGPVLNDATVEDAVAAGLGRLATIVDTGSNAPGAVLELCSPQFRELFEAAPVVVAKGQANYETLSDAGERVFCLLQVKCPVIAADAGVPVGSALVRRSG